MSNSNTRRALLSSVVALVICVTMLMGTTFAWFTDTANVNVNTIQSGTLTLKLTDDAGKDVEDDTLYFVNNEGKPITGIYYWEPGCTYNLQTLTITNTGNLNLKFKVVVTGINGDAVLNKVIDWTVKCGSNTYTEGSEIKLAPLASTTFTVSGHMQESAGNEYQEKYIDGISITVYATQDTVEYDSTTDDYDENAGYLDVDVWDGTIGIAPEVVNNVATVKTAEELASVIKALNEGDTDYKNSTIMLSSNLDLNGLDWTPIIDTWPGGDGSPLTGVVFDGNGKTISNFKLIGTSENKGAYGFFGYDVGATTIKNLNFENCVIDVTTTGSHTYAGILVGKVHSNTVFENINVNNCVVKSCWQAGGIGGGCAANSVNVTCTGNVTMSIKDSEIHKGTIQCWQTNGLIYGFGVNFNNASTHTNCSSTGTLTIGGTVIEDLNLATVATGYTSGNFYGAPYYLSGVITIK